MSINSDGFNSCSALLLIGCSSRFLMVLQHLLFSVTEPQYRIKPAGVSDVSLV